jgi:hypothetical protein
MGLKVFGCFTFLVGIVIVYVSFRADEFGVGEFPGVGEPQMLFSILGLLVVGVGILMVLAPKDPRPRG